jgi:hypothetical protein
VRLYDRLRKAGKGPHAAYLKGFCSAAGGDLFISVMQQARSESCDADAARPAHSAAPASAGLGRTRACVPEACWLALPAGGRDMEAEEPFEWWMAVRVIEISLAARAALDKPGADLLVPELKQRLQALLADRAAPVLLHGLQAWQPGACSPDRRSCTAHPAALLVPALFSCEGDFELAGLALQGRRLGNVHAFWPGHAF